MIYFDKYMSPLGNIIFKADEIGLICLYFETKNFSDNELKSIPRKKDLPIFLQTKKWLDIYFSGKEPSFQIPLNSGGTQFQVDVWGILRTIPYGKTVTYGQIAKLLCEKNNALKTSARAVGGAVGANKIAIIIPCHRVICANNRLSGYAWGADKKLALLKSEGVDDIVYPNL